MGCVPDTPIGLYVERSSEMLIGILGILLAGGAYVPIDPAYPEERVKYILEDAGIKQLVTQSQLRDKAILKNLTADILVISDETHATAPDITTTSDNLAYMIYTSGLQESQKGFALAIAISYILRLPAFEVYPHAVERFLLLSSFAFDSSLVGIFWTLCQGGYACSSTT